MNINTTKTVLSVKDYVEDELSCKKSAWSYKFKNSWNECDTWCDYINYFFLSNVLSQVYIIDSEIIPKGKKLGFAIPVKTYDTDLFSKVAFNHTEHSIEGVKGYLVGTDFTAKQDIKPAYITFYLTPDVKIPHQYILNRYKAILLTPTANIPVYITTGINANRNFLIDGLIRPTSKPIFIADRNVFAPFDFRIDGKATIVELSARNYINALADFNISTKTGLDAFRYLDPVAKLNIKAIPLLTADRNYAINGLINIGSDPNFKLIRNVFADGLVVVYSSADLQYSTCNNDTWDSWDTWDDYDNWDCSNGTVITANGIIIPASLIIFDVSRYLGVVADISSSSNNTLSTIRGTSITSNIQPNSNTTLDAVRNTNIISDIQPTSTASIVECCNCWGDFNTWEDRNTWLCN